MLESLFFVSLGLSTPEGYTKGVRFERFDGEVLFARSKAVEIRPNVNYPSFKYLYDAVRVTGSFCPPKTGEYRFKVLGKAFVTLSIMGKSYPKSLGPGGNCWPTTKTESLSDTFTMFAGRMYSFKIELRSGCNLYGQFLFLHVSFNGGDWVISEDFVAESVDECYPSYYGERCDMDCSDKCSGNGRCDDGVRGTGKCICDEGFLPPNCSEKINMVPAGCEPGVRWITYKDEIWFKVMRESKVITQVNEFGLDISFNSAVISGSILPPMTGEYQFRLYAKPYGQLQIGGRFYPKTLGPAGACWPTIKNDVITDSVFLFANQTYPFTIKYRTGCTLYTKDLVLYWKNGPRMNGDIERAPWEFVPAYALFTSSTQECIPGTFGENCQGICPQCPGNAFCVEGMEGDGTCTCKSGYYGEQCNVTCEKQGDCGSYGSCYDGKCYCDDFYYGDHCETFCSPNKTCSGNGKCSKTGTCICNDGYYGESCTQKSTEEGSNECKPGVKYTRYDGEVLFERIKEGPKEIDNVNVLLPSVLYDAAVLTGSVVVATARRVKFRLEAKPYGQLTIGGYTIPKSLGPGGCCWQTTKTAQETDWIDLIPNKFYPFQISYRSGCSLIEQYIKLLWKDETSDGFSIIPKANLRACNDKACSDRYSGDECSKFCSLDCGKHGFCSYGDDNTEKCLCSENWYGSNCNTYCLSAETCGTARSICGVNGACECESGFHGVNCTEPISNSLIGNSLSCTRSASLLWYSNEFFGTVKERRTILQPEVTIKTGTLYNSITISGSISVPREGLYRFKAEGKPTVKLSISGFNVGNPSFTAGRCDNGAATAETNAVVMHPNRMYPFTLQYRSGCSMYTKYLRLLYQVADSTGSFNDCEWIIVTNEMLRSCTQSECSSGYYGADCAGYCGDCGSNGRCSDGIAGTGMCECDDWHTGEKCQFNTFAIAIISFAIIFITSIIWVCWPAKLEEESSSSENDEPNSTHSQESDLRSSLINAPSIERMPNPSSNPRPQSQHGSQSNPRMSAGAAQLFRSQRSAFNI